MLITLAYFEGGNLNIPQLSQLTVREKLQMFIDRFEPEILIDLLGYEMYLDFLAALTLDPIPVKWLRLRDGAQYTYEDRVCFWPGLASVVSTANPENSLIANYVYYQLIKTDAKFLTGTGAVTSKTENSKRVSPIDLQVSAWNKMVGLNYKLIEFLNANPEDYPYEYPAK